MMETLKKGDIVVPIMVVDDVNVTSTMTPCRVIRVYKNGNVFVASEDGKITHHGPATGFQKVRSNA